MSHKIEIAPNLAIAIDGERVIGSKPQGLFLTTEMIVSDEDLKRLADRCLEVIVDTPQTEVIACPLQEENAEYFQWLYEDTPQTETSINSEKLQSGVEAKQPDCPWK